MHSVPGILARIVTSSIMRTNSLLVPLSFTTAQKAATFLYILKSFFSSDTCQMFHTVKGKKAFFSLCLRPHLHYTVFIRKQYGMLSYENGIAILVFSDATVFI